MVYKGWRESGEWRVERKRKRKRGNFSTCECNRDSPLRDPINEIQTEGRTTGREGGS
jgi:hypothetical protein